MGQLSLGRLFQKMGRERRRKKKNEGEKDGQKGLCRGIESPQADRLACPRVVYCTRDEPTIWHCVGKRPPETQIHSGFSDRISQLRQREDFFSEMERLKITRKNKPDSNIYSIHVPLKQWPRPFTSLPLYSSVFPRLGIKRILIYLSWTQFYIFNCPIRFPSRDRDITQAQIICVCLCVCAMYSSSCGDVNLFTQSRCGDSPPFRGLKASPCK